MTDLGLPLKGGLLTRLAPNSGKEDQTTAMNEIIDKLNTWNGVIVKQGTKTINIDATNQQSFLVPHNLGYAPVPFAFLNGVGISSLGLTNLNVPLPTFLGASTNGLVAGAVVHTSEISCNTDNNNLYFVVLNGTGSSLGNFTLSYYLMRITSDK